MAMVLKDTKGMGPWIREYNVNNTQTIVAGDIVVYSGGMLTKAADAAGAGTVVGVALEAITTTTAGESDFIRVDVNPFSVYTCPYKKGSKTSLLNSDRGTLFDLGDDAQSIDLDDTAGGFLEVVGFDNVAETADVLIRNRRI